MVVVPTVLGGVPSDRLGATYMHEHIFTLDLEIELNYPEGWDETERVAGAVAKLQHLKERGIDTIVDLTVLGLGRYIPRIQRIAEQVDLNIVVSTGLYTYNDLPLQFGFQDPEGPFGFKSEPLVEMFERDILNGIADTGVRAGMLKFATDEPGLTKGVVRVIRAVAATHKRTRTPITTHSNAPLRQGVDQQRLLREAGVDLSSVIVGHSGDTDDLAYLRQLMDAGSYIGMDRFGLDNILAFERRCQVVAQLAAEGYANRMVLSQDTCASSRFMDQDRLAALVPHWHYEHIIDDVLPELRRLGVSQGQIDEMLVANPRQIFESTAVMERTTVEQEASS